MFAVFAAAAVPLWRRVARNNTAASTSNPFLNKRAEALVGRVFHAGKADLRRVGHGKNRRYDLACRRARYACRQPRQNRAGRWRSLTVASA